MNRTFAIGFVVFNPGRALLNRLQLALDLGFHLYLYDNSPEDDFIRDFATNHTKCSYITGGKNLGLGVGLSMVSAQAYYESHKALLFFDQDTIFNTTTLEFIDEFYLENKKAIGPYYSSIVFNSKKIEPVASIDRFKINDVLLSINSGSLYFLKSLKKINWFNETYFVDCVDYEFCLRSNNNNLKIGECCSTPGFDHVSEQADVSYHFWGRHWRMRKYNHKRLVSTISSSLRLFISALISLNFKFACAILRSVIIYTCFQVLVRICNIFQ